MRDIKFRVWLPKMNTMVYDEDVYTSRVNELAKLNNYNYPLEGDEFYPWYDIYNFLGLKTNLEYMIPLQYTGLKDKNGVEIYEGDIVKHEAWAGAASLRDNLIGPVIFKDGCFAIKTTYGDKYLYTGVNKIIGNIYENPELFEEKY